MVSLLTLPTELQDAIISYLGRTSKLRLSKTCRALADTTLPHVYRKIHLTWKVTNSASKNPRIARLLRTVLANPHLAAAIKFVKFTAEGYTARKEGRLSLPKRVSGFSENDFVAAERVLSAVKMPERAEWETALRNKELDAAVALLISQCTNLQSLSLGAYFLNANFMLPIMLQHVLSKPGSAGFSDFSQLENICLGVDLDEYRFYDFFFLNMTAEAVLPFFYLPALKTARITLVDVPPSKPLPWPVASPPTANSLTTLRLQRTRASATTIHKLLNVCPNLSAFEYDYRPKVSQRMSCPGLADALASHQTTLKHLRICLQPYSTDTLDPQDFGGEEFLVGSLGLHLKNFTAMETLEIPIVVLQGWDVDSAAPLSSTLPPNLQTLTIRDDCGAHTTWEWTDKACIKLFYEFLKHGRWRDTCPHLRFINLWLENAMLEDWDERTRENFKKMCRVKGLDCGIYKAHEDFVEEKGITLNKPEDRGEILGAFFK